MSSSWAWARAARTPRNGSPWPACRWPGVEARLVGGECPYWGCIPSKMMIRAANLLAEGRRIPGLAGSSQVHPDWAPVAQRIREEATDNWDDKVAVDRFTGKGGTLFRGHGRITAPGEVTVGGEVLRARRGIVINTGTQPFIPPIDGLAGTPYWTNREAIEATEVPASLLVLSGGAVGAELSQVFARFGSRVTVIEESGSLLPAEEPESGTLLADVFRREGIEVRTSTTARAVRHDGHGLHPVPVRRHRGDRGGAAGRDRAADRPGRDRRRPGGGGRERPCHPGRRPPAGRAGSMGHRRHHRPRRVHPHVDVPGEHRRRTTSSARRSPPPSTTRSPG